MPLYEYECESCQKRFEKIRKFSDPPLERCDLCGDGPIRKLFSSPAIQFKGSGFYITDYAKKSTEAGQAADQAGGTKSSSSESDSSAKSDSKSDSSSSAEKPESKSKTDSSSSSSSPSKSDSPKSNTSSSAGGGAAAKTTTKTE